MNTTTQRPEWTDREVATVRGLIGKYGLTRVINLIGELTHDAGNPNAGRFLATTSKRAILLPFEERRARMAQERLANSR